MISICLNDKVLCMFVFTVCNQSVYFIAWNREFIQNIRMQSIVMKESVFLSKSK